MSRHIDLRAGTDYFLIGGLIAVSGFPFFLVAQANFMILFVITFYVYLKRSLSFDFRVLPIVLSFLVVEILQFMFIKPFDPVMISGTFIRMFLGFFIVMISGQNFSKYYVNIICFFSLVSFIFYPISMLFPPFFNFFTDHICPFFTSPFGANEEFYVVWPTNILFCFHECVLNEFRNPGPFWEPGLFAVFLNLALLFHLIQVGELFNWKTGVLILAIGTTFSTAGYIACFVLLFSFYLVRQSPLRKIIFSLVAMPIILYLYYSLSFLSTKVDENINLAASTTSSRFGSASVDLADFASSPYIGWGRGVMRYGGRAFSFFSEEQHRNNSVTDLLATYGIFLFILFFFSYYQSFKYLCINSGFPSKFALYALLVVLTLGFSQSIFLRPFFHSLLFVQFVFKKEFSA